MLYISGIAKKNRIRIEVESNLNHISIWRLLNYAVLTVILWVLNLFLTTHRVASTTDKGVTPITTRSLPQSLPATTLYIFTTLFIPARRKLSRKIQSPGLDLWGTVALMELYILKNYRWLRRGAWEDMRKSPTVGIIGLTFSRFFRLWSVRGWQDRDFAT